MKNFKLFRTGSLILALFLLFAVVYIILTKFEIAGCCTFGADHYELGTFFNVLFPKDFNCNCEFDVSIENIDSLPKSGWVIPMDLIISDLLCWCVFIYFQFFKKITSNVK